jgi:hypothetical protein
VKFGGPWVWKMLLCFMTTWDIFRLFGMIYGPSVKFAVIWYTFPVLLRSDQGKSGNLALNNQKV